MRSAMALRPHLTPRFTPTFALAAVLMLNQPKTRGRVDWKAILKTALPIVIDVVTQLAK